MQKTNSVTIQFNSQSVNEAFARVSVSAFVAQLDPTVEELYDIKMAVSEAVTNSIIHGYAGSSEGIITVKCSYEDRKVMIEIIDNGKGINNVEEAMTPLYTTSIDEERAGLGFSVMQEMTDNVEVCSHPDTGTTVRLTKELGKAGDVDNYFPTAN